MAKVKHISGLDCSAPADKMVRLVLRTQLKSMCALREKALDWDEPEGVHNKRVMSRRLRSAMSDFKPYLRQASLPRLKLRSIATSLHIYFPLRIKELHELRILAKRLRYAIELFAVCWGEELEEIAKEVSLLQTSLGELQDCDVWIESLGGRLKQTARKDKSDEENARLREGAAWLLSHFARERMAHYRDALARWQQWTADGFLDRLKSILARDLFPANPQEKVHS